MSDNVLNRSVGDLVLEAPDIAAIFRRHGVDFCCGGQKKLSDALLNSKVSEETILKEIEQAIDKNANKAIDGKEKVVDKNLTDLVNYIEEKHHSFLKKQLPEISKILKVVRNVHGDNHPELYEIYDNFIALKEELTEHIGKEEQAVFPLIRELERDKKALDNAKIGLILKELEDEHQKAGDLLKINKRLSHSYMIPKDACTSFELVYNLLSDLEEDTFHHIHLENNLLHQKVKAKLS